MILGVINWYEQRFWDCRRQLWHGTASRLLYKGHSGHTKMKFFFFYFLLWHWFKISPIVADLCYIKQRSWGCVLCTLCPVKTFGPDSRCYSPYVLCALYFVLCTGACSLQCVLCGAYALFCLGQCAFNCHSNVLLSKLLWGWFTHVPTDVNMMSFFSNCLKNSTLLFKLVGEWHTLV